MNTNVDSVLAERGSRYGDFKTHAEITQTLKAVVASQLIRLNKHLSPSQQESIDMIFHKIGRIINGDPNYIDSWVDIGGYSKLIVDELEQQEKQLGKSKRTYGCKARVKDAIKGWARQLGSNIRKKNKGTEANSGGYGPGYTGGVNF
jgi:hypothetical protein